MADGNDQPDQVFTSADRIRQLNDVDRVRARARKQDQRRTPTQ